jgi:predicted nucleotidyltransferase
MNLSNIEINLIYYLSLQKESKYSKQISKETGISTGAASQSLRNLAKKGIILCKIQGKEKYYYTDLNSSLVKYFKIGFNLYSINKLVIELKPFSEKVVLFGSYANGLNTEDSDIDLFILSLDKIKIKEILNQYKIHNKLSAILFTAVEYNLLKNKDKPLYDEINKGIVLWDKKNE